MPKNVLPNDNKHSALNLMFLCFPLKKLGNPKWITIYNSVRGTFVYKITVVIFQSELVAIHELKGALKN